MFRLEKESTRPSCIVVFACQCQARGADDAECITRVYHPFVHAGLGPPDRYSEVLSDLLHAAPDNLVEHIRKLGRGEHAVLLVSYQGPDYLDAAEVVGEVCKHGPTAKVIAQTGVELVMPWSRHVSIHSVIASCHGCFALFIVACG